MNTEVTVREVMDREYVGVTESDDLVETVELLLREEAETAVVLRGSDPVGVLTERDVLALVVEGTPEEATVGDAMTESVPTVSPEASLDGAADRMSARSARRLVVTNGGGEPLGLITEHDLLTTRTHDPTAEAESPELAAVDSGAGTALAADNETEAEDSFEDQGICEVCGTFTGELTTFNGQLLCADCRDM